MTHEKRLEIRWRDLDAYGHVYHGTYLAYLEEGRDAWLRAVLGLADGDVWDYVVARIAIDYRGELRGAGGQAVVRCRVERVGRSSVTTREEIYDAEGRLTAEAEVVVVARDPATGGSRPLADAERAALEP